MIRFQSPISIRFADWWEPHYDWWKPGQPWWEPMPAGSSFMEKLCSRVMFFAAHRRHLLRVRREQRAAWKAKKPTRQFIKERANAELVMERLLLAGWTPTEQPETEDGYQTWAQPKPDTEPPAPEIRPPTELETEMINGIRLDGVLH